MEPSPTFLDPLTLARTKDLELTARRLVEGLVSGSHKSPYQGVSVEFAEHREYVAGDDIRRIDWKVFGKTDKFYLKRFEQETNLVCHLVVDASESMKYASSDTSKHLYASRWAACVAHLVLRQTDSVGITFFEDKIRYHVPSSSQPSHLRQILHLLAVCQPANLDSRIGPVLEEIADRLKKRSLVIVLSDFFDDVDGMINGLRKLRYKRHEVVAFHVLDPHEIEFPFRDLTLFKGLERLPDVMADPHGLRQAYLESFGKYRRQLQVGCRSADIDYQLLRTDQPIDRALSSYLAVRALR